MNRGVIFCLAALLVIGCLAEDSKVVVLTSENFEEAVKTKELTLVKFFAPWCGHCKALAEPYQEAAAALAESDLDPRVALAEIDCDDHSDECQKFEIRGFPTLKLFKNGIPVAEYDQERSKEGLMGFMAAYTQPAVIEMATVEEVMTKRGDDSCALFVGGKDSDFFKLYEAVAEDYLTVFDFYFVPGQEALVQVFNGNPEPAVYNIETDGEFGEWFDLNRRPLVMRLDRNTFRDAFYEGAPPVCIYFHDPKGDSTDVFVDSVNAFVAAGHDPRKATFGTMDGVLFSRFLEKVGHTTMPALTCIDLVGDDLYTFDQSMTVEFVTKFLVDLVEGNLVPTLRSEPIPENPVDPEDGTYVLVGESYESIMEQNKDKARVVFVYAPWCTHCNSFKPIYKKIVSDSQDEKFIGSFYSEGESVLFTKIDGDSNDIPQSGISITGFPTLFMLPAGSDEAIVFDGERGEVDVIEWVLKNGNLKVSNNWDDEQFHRDFHAFVKPAESVELPDEYIADEL